MQAVLVYIECMRVDLSPRLGDTQWPINPPLLSSPLIHLHSLPPRRNGV